MIHCLKETVTGATLMLPALLIKEMNASGVMPT
jgi:hypothetical protein